MGHLIMVVKLFLVAFFAMSAMMLVIFAMPILWVGGVGVLLDVYIVIMVPVSAIVALLFVGHEADR
jgi:hypothetical protein